MSRKIRQAIKIIQTHQNQASPTPNFDLKFWNIFYYNTNSRLGELFRFWKQILSIISVNTFVINLLKRIELSLGSQLKKVLQCNIL